MEAQTRKSKDAIKWVLNQIQSNRAVNSRSGKHTTIFQYKKEGNFPELLHQKDIIRALSDEGAIQVITKDWGGIRTEKHGIVSTPNDASWDVALNGNITPDKLYLKIIEEKLFPFLCKYNIIEDEDKIKYDFDHDKKCGVLTIGQQTLPFKKDRAILLDYFYKNRNKLRHEADFETYKDYLIKEGYWINKETSEPFNKTFRDEIKRINKRIEKKFNNIESVITEPEEKAYIKRNKYKWEIKFKNI